MNKSLKTNYLFNLANTISGLLFPLITFPYASRILLADGIGQVTFFQSIIQYITLLTCLGIPMYAVREVSKVRDNVELRNNVTIEILLLHVFLSAIGYLIVAVLAQCVAQIHVDVYLFFVLSATIIFTAIGCEWFYQGVEDFKYITIRGLIVKILSVVFLFAFVKTKDDLLWYAAYLVFGTLGSNIFNFLRLRKYIPIMSIKIKELNPFRHFVPALHIFLLTVIVSIYIQLNTIMLGFLDGPTSVGLFTASSKLSNMLLSIVSSLVVIMLPRASNLLATGNGEEFKRLSQKSIQFNVAITTPMTVGLFLLAPTLIPLFCGNTYIPAVLTLQILSPVIFFIGLGYTLGTQILYPQKKENIVILATLVGAIINIVLNYLLIPKYSYNGAAIATLITEFLVTINLVVMGNSYIPIMWRNKSHYHYFIGSFLMGIIVFLWNKTIVFEADIINLLISCFIGAIVYVFYLILVKDSLIQSLKDLVLSKKQ